ncbi:MAG: hypothetical protein ACTS4X_01215, partial [Candidatus Hodgkinia cicadicola]
LIKITCLSQERRRERQHNADHKASAVNVRVFSQELNATNCPPKLSNTINILRVNIFNIMNFRCISNGSSLH